ncbi:MAG: AmpD protein [Gammaproteobacteria bacterium]|jgi:AmpD protein
MKSFSLCSVDKIVDSPNYDARPTGTPIDALIIHAISLPPANFGNDFVESFFTNQLESDKHPYFKEIQHLRVSAHFYIKRCGTITQFVNPESRAWHAGESVFTGVTCVNDFSIGIEMEGCDTLPFEPIQYSQLISLTKELMCAYPLILKSRVVGHSDISPGRKTDPGPCFDWEGYLVEIQ